MYTFNIETIHNKKVLRNSKSDSKIVGGTGTQFKVYRASDINRLFGDSLTEDNYKSSIKAFTDRLSIEELCDYYFSYIIYDTFDNEKFRSHFFSTVLESLQNKLLIIKDIRGSNGETQVIQYNTSDIQEDNRSLFCNYIWPLFDIKSGQQTTELPEIDFFSDDSLVLSEGQYLNHLDEIYSKYSDIILKYKDLIDSIKENDDEYDDESKDETEIERRREVVQKYNKEKDEIIKKNKAYVGEKEIPDEKYIVLHLLFLNETYFDPQGKEGQMGKHKSYLLLIDERYARLDLIKELNLFYNTNKMFIRNKDEFLKSIESKIKEETTFQTLSAHNGIEKLLNIYYAYIPHESTKDDKAIHEVFYDLCIKISDFFIKNKNIYNLLVFNDTIFFKMIKDDLILTLYDLEKQFEHKFGFVRDQDDNIHFDIQQGYTIDIEYIKQMMFYRYKQLEQTIRRMYLENYKGSMIVLGDESSKKYSAPKFYEIINSRKKKITIGFYIWPHKQYHDRMIHVIDFYRIGRLVEYLVLPDGTPREGDESRSDRYIGVITNITGLTYTMKRLSQIPLSLSDGDDSNISIDNIRETEYILCDEIIASSDTEERKSTAWAASACDTEDVKIKYHDTDLFDPIYDIEIYIILQEDIKLKLTEKPKCLVLRSAIIVDHKHRKKQTMQFAQDGSIAQDDSYSEDFEETIDLDTETYVSIYEIENGNSLRLSECFSVCNTKLKNIEAMIVDPMKTYTDDKPFCFLIEKVSTRNIVPSRYPCDTLFFIDEKIKNNILAFES